MSEASLDLAVNDALIVNADGSAPGNIGIQDGRIAAIEAGPLPARREIDAGGHPVIPGVVDAHCHFRIVQGQGPDAIASSDDYVIGPRAAAFGGVTTFIDFAIQQRGHSAHQMVESRIAEAAAGSVIDFSFHASLTDPHRLLQVLHRLRQVGLLRRPRLPGGGDGAHRRPGRHRGDPRRER